MNTLNNVAVILLFVLIVTNILLWWQGRGRRRRELDSVSQQLLGKVGEGLQQHLTSASEQLLILAKERLGSEKTAVTTDLAHKKEQIEKMVEQLSSFVQQGEQNRLQSFSALTQELKQQRHLAEQLTATTEGLKKLLSNNQLRGQFGEQVAEDLLQMSGFVRGTDYEVNKTLTTATTRPDFTIFLPDKSKINVDVKFPYGNLQRALDAPNKAQRLEHLKAFKQDIKQKIKQVTSRDYINPEEQTVDFVILFIPNEMIFSYVYDKMNDIWAEAMRNKVVLAGPFSFTATLRLIRQAHNSFVYQKNTQEIIRLIAKFEEEYLKYTVEFSKIGERLDAAAKQFEKVNTTRHHQLTRTVDRILLIEESKRIRLEQSSDEEEK